jgi:hypothetical protein
LADQERLDGEELGIMGLERPTEREPPRAAEELVRGYLDG